MALAVMHILGAIIILDLLRHYVVGLKKFPRYLIAIGGIAGLAPDIDIPLSWVYGWVTGTTVNFHATPLSHSFLWVLLFLALGFAFHLAENKKWRNIFYVIAAGWTIHIGFDWFYGEYKLIFWPLMTPEWIFPSWKIYNHAESIDAILLVLWIMHEETHKFVKDYF